MHKSGKALLTTAVVGGIGALIHNAKNLKKKSKKNSNNYTPASIHLHINHMQSKQKILVNRIYSLIIPKHTNNYEYQKYVHDYLKSLLYISHRYQMHSADMAKLLHMNLNRAENLTIALSQQHIVEHTDMATIGTSRDSKGANFCCRKIALKDAKYILMHMNSGLVDVKTFPHMLKSIIAYHVL